MKDPDHPALPPSLIDFLQEAQREVGLPGEVSVRITSNAEMRRFNRDFRDKDKPTDVLSFPATPDAGRGFAGDIAISADIARANAKSLGHSFEDELKVLLLHGLLHLAGHDHERDNGKMRRLEQKLRAKLHLPSGLIERSNGRRAPGGSSGGSLLQQGGAGLQSSGRKRAVKRGALAPGSGTPALKRRAKKIAIRTGALKRSSPLLKQGAPTGVASTHDGAPTRVRRRA